MSGDRALAVLKAHFEAQHAAGTPAKIWWRDDDATAPGPKLDALLALARAHGAPVALAVIPARVAPALLGLCARQNIAILQHGAHHVNHQTTGKAAELGDARPIETIVAELASLRSRLEGPVFVPVMVPPWNRMRPDLVAPLAEAGYCGLSRFGAGPAELPLRAVDTHIDPIAWRTTRSLAGDAALARMAARAIDVGGPIGLLTHHIVHDHKVDGFVRDFAKLVSDHPGANWVSAREIFAGDP